MSDGGVAESFFNVALDEHHGGAEKRGEHSHRKDQMERGRTQAVERRQAGQEKAAGINDPGMQKGMHRRRRVQGIGQPHVQGKLRRLRHSADEDQKGYGSGRADLETAGPECYEVVGRCGAREELLQIQRSIPAVSENHGGEKRSIARALHDKCPESAPHGGQMLIVVGKQRQQPAQKLPEDEQHQQIAARHHAEQRESREGKQAVKSGVTPFLLHVADGKGVDQNTDRRDMDQHYDRKAVDIESELKTGGPPGHLDGARPAGDDLEQKQER